MVEGHVLAVPARRLAESAVSVDEPVQVSAGRTMAYCGVCGGDQSDDLERQVGRVMAAATAVAGRGCGGRWGSGVSGRRRTLTRFVVGPDA